MLQQNLFQTFLINGSFFTAWNDFTCIDIYTCICSNLQFWSIIYSLNFWPHLSFSCFSEGKSDVVIATLGHWPRLLIGSRGWHMYCNLCTKVEKEFLSQWQKSKYKLDSLCFDQCMQPLSVHVHVYLVDFQWFYFDQTKSFYFIEHIYCKKRPTYLLANPDGCSSIYTTKLCCKAKTLVYKYRILYILALMRSAFVILTVHFMHNFERTYEIV